MKPLGSLTEHVLLARRMARTADLDLARAQDTGALSQDDWAAIVHTCRGCSWSESCDSWLKQHDIEPCAPATCLNRARFEALRREQTET